MPSITRTQYIGTGYWLHGQTLNVDDYIQVDNIATCDMSCTIYSPSSSRVTNQVYSQGVITFSMNTQSAYSATYRINCNNDGLLFSYYFGMVVQYVDCSSAYTYPSLTVYPTTALTTAATENDAAYDPYRYYGEVSPTNLGFQTIISGGWASTSNAADCPIGYFRFKTRFSTATWLTSSEITIDSSTGEIQWNRDIRYNKHVDC